MLTTLMQPDTAKVSGEVSWLTRTVEYMSKNLQQKPEQLFAVANYLSILPHYAREKKTGEKLVVCPRFEIVSLRKCSHTRNK